MNPPGIFFNVNISGKNRIAFTFWNDIDFIDQLIIFNKSSFEFLVVVK